MSKFTPGPWQLKSYSNSSQLEIWAEVNIGGKKGDEVLQPIYNVSIEPSFQIDANGALCMHLSYDSWRQFPSPDFRTMQRANGYLMAAAPEMYAALKTAAWFYDQMALSPLEAAAKYGDEYTPPSDADWLQARGELQAAIDKAEGRERSPQP